jgi:hypothetical protein
MAITITDTGDGGLTYTAEDGSTQTLTWNDVDSMVARRPTQQQAAAAEGEPKS